MIRMDGTVLEVSTGPKRLFGRCRSKLSAMNHTAPHQTPNEKLVKRLISPYKWFLVTILP